MLFGKALRACAARTLAVVSLMACAMPSRAEPRLRQPGAIDASMSLPEVQAALREAPYYWLRPAFDARAQRWVSEQNRRTLHSFRGHSDYDRALALVLNGVSDPHGIGNSTIRVGSWVYQQFADEAHPKGAIRRVDAQHFFDREPSWEVVADVGVLYPGASVSLFPNWRQIRGPRGILCFTTEAVSTLCREYDFASRAFAAAGFQFELMTAARSQITNFIWEHDDTLLVTLPRGDHQPARLVRWRRGTSLDSAQLVFEAPANFSTVRIGAPANSPTPLLSATRVAPTSGDPFHQETVMWRVANGGAQKLTFPTAPIGFSAGQWLFLPLSEPWTINNATWQTGDVITIADADAVSAAPSVRLAWRPGSHQRALSVYPGREGIVVTYLDNVRARAVGLLLTDGAWTAREITLPDNGAVGSVFSAQDTTGDGLTYIRFETFLQPPSVYAIDVASGQARLVTQAPTQFDARDLITEQFWAVSADGVGVPYFLTHRRELSYDGSTPTLMWAYGSHNTPSSPGYDPALGKLWLERGGAYVLANIRGGGELGPDWALYGSNREPALQDFAAVARDLFRRRITAPNHLGIRGHSNGGFLIAASLNRTPELFGAAVIENGVIDPLAALLAEEGSDLGDWNVPYDRRFLMAASPFQNLRQRRRFPAPLVTTNSDDGVEPYWSREYAARLNAFGMKYYYYEDPSGDHGLSERTPMGRARHDALVFTHLARELGPMPGALP